MPNSIPPAKKGVFGGFYRNGFREKVGLGKVSEKGFGMSNLLDSTFRSLDNTLNWLKRCKYDLNCCQNTPLSILFAAGYILTCHLKLIINPHMQARTVYLIKRVETEVTNQMTKAMSPFDVTPLQYSILSFVAQEGSNFSSAQLARRFNMAPQSMNEAVAILQRKELIVKTTDAENKRILRLGLTDKGETALENCHAELDEIEQNLFSELANNRPEQDNELAVFRALLGKVLAKAK
jgi:DNA-binding MarR family transcriptional regulator